jgi:hypothetical protein
MSFAARSGVFASLTASGIVAGVSLGACAGSGAAVGAPVEVRVLVQLVRPSADAAAISAEASRQAQVPVAYAAATSPAWHALVLRCGSAAACEAAIGRLRGAASTYSAVELDGRRHRAPQ